MPTMSLSTPIGLLDVRVDDAGRLVSIEIGDGVATPTPTPTEGGAALAPARVALERYFAGEVGAIDDLEVAPERGTEFQRSVWAALRRIPVGETISYAELAAAVGRPKAFRAVGAANGANPIAIVVPCHRVVNAGGALGGYAYGLDAKRWLLSHEGAVASATLPGLS